MEKYFSRANIKLLLDNINDGMQIVDKDGNLVFSNKTVNLYDGININTELGKHILDIYPSLTEFSSTLLKVIRTGIPILEYQQTYSTYKGREVTTVNSTLPIRDDKGELIGAVEISRNITEVKALTEKVADLQKRVYGQKTSAKYDIARYSFGDIVTDDIYMLELKNIAARVAQTDAPIMVVGETGTGKELFVQAIHNSSRRLGSPFIAQNCAALPSTLLEGILFGTMKGSFTGSVDRPGLFELANGGTLFLDEINSLPMELQAKLLRVLQEGSFRRIGDMRARYADVRIITAINMNPEKAVSEGLLRQDLLYRLNTITLNLPPLRDRKADIPILVKYFLKIYNQKLNRNIKGVTDEVMNIFCNYNWDGNVRELEHIIEGSLSIMEGDVLKLADLPQRLRAVAEKLPKLPRNNSSSYTGYTGRDSLRVYLENEEKKAIESTLLDVGGNITKASKILGLPRQTLQYKIKKYKINHKNTI